MTDDRFAVQVEHRLAGLLSPEEAVELSNRLESSGEARGLYLRAVEVHLDLGTALDATAPEREREDGKETSDMARISLNCSCGWNFFIPGTTTGHETSCPSCAQSVRIPGRKPGEHTAKSAGEVAAEAQQRQGMIRNAVLAAVVLVVAGVIGFWALQKPELEPTPEKIVRPRPPMVPPIVNHQPPSTPPIVMPEPTRTPPPVDKAAIIEEHKRGVVANVWLINMTGLISESLRFRNLGAEWSQLQAEMSAYDDKIKKHLTELARLREPMTIEKYLLPGDQIFGFAQQDFTTMKYRDAAAFIQGWVSRWVPNTNLEQLHFARNDQRLSIYVEFSQTTSELQSLVHSPLLGREGTPDDALVVVQMPVPADVVKNINSLFDALPLGYRTMGMDRKKLEDMLKRKNAPSDDIEWMKTRILGEALPAYQRDADHIRSKILELEPKLRENVAGDVIIFKDKRKVECQIIEQTPDYIKVKGRFGGAKYPMSEIEKIEQGKGAALEFPPKFAEAMKPAAPLQKLEKLVPLLAWCVEKNLSIQKEYTAYVILTQDASHEGARKMLNLARPK